MSPKPTARPNLNKQNLAAGLAELKQITRTHKEINPISPDPKNPEVIETKVKVDALRYPLAGNVSQDNLDRLLAKVGA